MAQTSGTDAEGRESGIDRINLRRALQDFEIANARVVDLTARLTGLARELSAAQERITELELRDRRNSAQLVSTTTELSVIKGSRAYRAARRIGDARARLS